jgi:surface antigen
MRKIATLAVAMFAISCVAIANPTPTHALEKKSEKTSEKQVDKKSANKKNKVKIYTVKTGDTLQSIAKKYGTDYPRLFSANTSIVNPDIIDVGDRIRIPAKSEKIKARQIPTVYNTVTPASNVTTTRSYSNAPVNSTSYYIGNGMWCTDYVHSKRPDVPVYANAGYGWISAAKADGKATGSTPKTGSVAVTNGHVAYVEKVNRNGSYVVSEMGWNYTAGNYNKRTVQPGTFGAFIYK